MDKVTVSNIAENLGHDWLAFFHSLFVRQQFTSHLISRNFFSVRNLSELALTIVLMFLCFKVAGFIQGELFNPTEQKKRGFFSNVIRGLAGQLLLPLMLFMVGLIASSLWYFFTKMDSVWLGLMIFVTPWLIIFRFALAIYNYMMPNYRLSEHAKHILAIMFIVLFVLWIAGVTEVILKWLHNITFPIGKNNISLYVIITACMMIALVVIVAMWLARLMENRVMQLSRLDLNLRIALSKIIKTLMVFLAILVVLPLVGLDLTMLSVFGGALGVGLGFGLQNIASNYISGFIILFDRSIRVGDRLVVNDFTGYVTRITSRFVVLRSLAGEEALVPNQEFVSNMVINASFSESPLWHSLEVQVAYDSNLPRALEIMVEIASNHVRVNNTTNPPSAYVTEMADSGINLKVGFWVKDPENGFLSVSSDILLAIWQRFGEEGIEFPFPQREVRILNDDHKISLKNQ